MIVYMNESYNNKNYCCREDYMYYPNEDQDLTTIAHHKGQHYWFIAANFDADYSVPEFERTDAQNAGLLFDTLDIFEGGSKQTKDYHGILNHEYFVGWMHNLPDALKKQNIYNTIIAMDNAKCHKKLPDDIPQMGCKKEKLIE